jgi:hypothetical protein
LSAFADPELSELFDGEPELLAIADAIRATTPRDNGSVHRGSSHRRRLLRPFAHRWRAFFAIAITLALIAAAPAFAFSSSMRRLVGLESARSHPPVLHATITDVTVQHRLTVDFVTVHFSVGEPGKPAGSGIPKLSAFFVSVVPKHGEPANQLRHASGANGRYVATAFIPHGGIQAIEIGGWLNRKGTPTAAGGFFIPVIVVDRSGSV